MKMPARVVLVTSFLLAWSLPALTEENSGEADCQALATAQGRQLDPEFVRVTLDLPMQIDRYDAPLGRQHISTVYSGTAIYEALPGGDPRQFICLHGGKPGGALFLAYLPLRAENPDLTKHNQYETWHCRAQREFPVVYNSVRDDISLTHDGRAYRLRHVRSASGARFQDETLVWWGKGREARLFSRQGRQETELDVCQLQVVAQP